MTRSHKYRPGVGTTCKESETQDKRDANRALRRQVRQRLAVDIFDETLPALREVSEIWTFAKDGVHWVRQQYCNPEFWPLLWRK